MQRAWRAHNLQPHRVQNFKFSRDPHFVEKLRDIVGLYMDPPMNAIVLSVQREKQRASLGSEPLRSCLCVTVSRRAKRTTTGAMDDDVVCGA